MSDPTSDRSEGAVPGPVVRDRRRLDPETGQLRDAYGSTEPPTPVDPSAAGSGESTSAAEPDRSGGEIDPVGLAAAAGSTNSANSAGSAGSAGSDDSVGPVGSVGSEDPIGSGARDVSLDGILADLDAAQASAAERLSDLQRLQAEFMNYRRRVERDRDVARDTAVAGILEALLPVLDDVHLARQHGDLDGGPFAAIAEKLEGVLQRFGLSRYGEHGEEFDPTLHEALMHTEAELPEGTLTTTIVQVLQPGYRTGDRVLRAARVAVADPQ